MINRYFRKTDLIFKYKIQNVMNMTGIISKALHKTKLVFFSAINITYVCCLVAKYIFHPMKKKYANVALMM